MGIKELMRPHLRKSRNKRYGITPNNFHVDAYLRYLGEEIEIEQALADETDDISCESHASDVEARISTEFLTGKKPRPYITHYSQLWLVRPCKVYRIVKERCSNSTAD